MRSLPLNHLPILLMLALCSCALAQTPDAATIKTDVKSVMLPTTVRDKHGKTVTDLTVDDFVLSDDGKPQHIDYFSHDTNLPLTLGLLVDTSMSQHDVLPEERAASQHFLEQMMTDPKDKAFIIQFDREVELLQDITDAKDKLHDALDKVAAPQFASASSGDDSGGHHGGGTTLYDAVFLASDELLRKQPGRKAIIVLTDGVDRGSKETLNSAIEAAQRSDTAVYAIYFKGAEQNYNNPGMGRRRGGMGGGGWPGGGGGYPGGGGGYPGGGGGQRPEQTHVDGKKILQQLCGETGGMMFEAKKQKVDEVYTSIAEELRSQYILAFTPDKAAEPGFHKLALTVKKKDMTVQTRAGYYVGQ
jgi:VWFA-related protein